LIHLQPDNSWRSNNYECDVHDQYGGYNSDSAAQSHCLRQRKWRGTESAEVKEEPETLDTPRELAHELKLWKLRCPPSDHDLAFTTLGGGFIHRKNAGQVFESDH